jgi:hypothetical protein
MKSRSIILLSGFSICLLLGTAGTAHAGPAEILAGNAQARREVIALLRQNKLAEGRQRLNAVRPITGKLAPGNIDIGQQWIRIAYQLRNAGERALALQAADEAKAIALSLATQRSRDSERASFLANTGLMCERLEADLGTAKLFYGAALTADPSSERIKQRLALTENKLRQRAAAKARS